MVCTGVDEIEHAPVHGALAPSVHPSAQSSILCKSPYDVLLPNPLSAMERIDEGPGEHDVRYGSRSKLSVDKILQSLAQQSRIASVPKRTATHTLLVYEDDRYECCRVR